MSNPFHTGLGQGLLEPSNNSNCSQGSFCQVVWRVLFTKMTHQSVAGRGNGASTRAHLHMLRKVLKKECSYTIAILFATETENRLYGLFREQKLSLKDQRMTQQMIKLMCVTKVILRVPNRRFFPRINLPAQMGQAAHVNWALWDHRCLPFETKKYHKSYPHIKAK